MRNNPLKKACFDWRYVVSVILICLALPVQALVYFPRMDEAEWIIHSSVFECSMTQPIPIYGKAVFSQQAGERLKFHLYSRPSPMKRGQAKLTSKTPVYKPGSADVDMGQVSVSESQYPVRLDAAMATRLFAELEKGRMAAFKRMSWFADEELIDVAISPVNFKAAYREYRRCLANLLPVNFDQIRRSRVHFATAKWDLTPETISRLDLVVLYAKADKEVNAFYVDGHTDSRAGRLYNLELSRKRAESVANYLKAKGIPEEQITLRYHGERYPVQKNSTAKGRLANRRVTIRLEKEADI